MASLVSPHKPQIAVMPSKLVPGTVARACVSRQGSRAPPSPPQVRRIFISLTEKFILLMKSKFQDFHPNHLVMHINKMLNRYFFILCSRGENDLDNLLAMYNVILNYICKFDLPPHFAGALQPGSADTLTELFLEGAVTVPLYMLVDIDLDVLKYLLLALTQLQQLAMKASDRQVRVRCCSVRAGGEGGGDGDRAGHALRIGGCLSCLAAEILPGGGGGMHCCSTVTGSARTLRIRHEPHKVKGPLEAGILEQATFGTASSAQQKCTRFGDGIFKDRSHFFGCRFLRSSYAHSPCAHLQGPFWQAPSLHETPATIQSLQKITGTNRRPIGK